MKKNNKGFLMVETVVVSTFVMFVLIVLYAQFSTLLVNYNKSYTYNTSNNIYNLSAIRDYLIENQGEGNTTLNSYLNSSKIPYIIIYSDGKCNQNISLSNVSFCTELAQAGKFKTILYTNSDVTDLKEYINSNHNNVIKQKFKNFIVKINNTEYKKRLIAEYEDATFGTITYGVNTKE